MIFIDRSVPRAVAQALKLVRDDVIWFEDRFRHDTKDRDWLPEAGANNWRVISRDKNIRYKKDEIRAIKENSVGCFILGEKRDLSRWNLLRIIVSCLDEMELRHQTTDRPCIFLIDASGAFRRVL